MVTLPPDLSGDLQLKGTLQSVPNIWFVVRREAIKPFNNQCNGTIWDEITIHTNLYTNAMNSHFITIILGVL